MLVDKLFYFLREAWRNYRTNPVVSSVSTGIISLSILIFGLFLVVFFNFQNLSDRWGRKVRVDAYLVENLTAEQNTQLESSILNIPGVEKVEYISADEALEEFREMLGEDDALLNELETNPLPASYKTHLAKSHRSPQTVRAIAEKIGEMPGVDQVRYGAEWIEKFDALIQILQLLGLIIGCILFLSSLLIISNTIRLTIFARREEIEIMRLVGATETFIRIPFFLEGLLQGFTAGVLAIALLWVTYWAVLVHIEMPLASLGPATFSFLPSIASWGLVTGGTVIGILGSAFALSRSEEKNEG